MIETLNDEVTALVSAALASRDTGWSVGEFGAIGEFHHSGDFSKLDGLTVDTTGGSLRVMPGRWKPVAYEAISGRPRQWLHGVAFCLPVEMATMNSRSRITELGIDAEAIAQEDRNAVLFDLGLFLKTVDFCVRTTDAHLIELLRRACGTSLLAAPALYDALRCASPHRVLVSRVARLEIRSAIPAPHAHPVAGPHTHLLPKLLNRNRGHSANLPIPEGWTPCLYMYPPHPIQDAQGRERGFDREHHLRFQGLMERFGTPAQMAAKEAVLRAWSNGGSIEMPEERRARLATRVAARQLAAQSANVL